MVTYKDRPSVAYTHDFRILYAEPVSNGDGVVLALKDNNSKDKYAIFRTDQSPKELRQALRVSRTKDLTGKTIPGLIVQKGSKSKLVRIVNPPIN